MTIAAIFSPPTLGIGGSGPNFTTQFTSSPWPGGVPVWLQCTTKYVAGDGQSDFGILELDVLGEQCQRIQIGNPDVYENISARRFVPRFLGVTVAANTFDAAISGTLTMFLWS